MISVGGPTSTTPCLTRYAPSAPLADPVAGSSSTPTGEANIRVCTVDRSSTVTVVNSISPWALCCSQTLLSSAMLGLANSVCEQHKAQGLMLFTTVKIGRAHV